MSYRVATVKEHANVVMDFVAASRESITDDFSHHLRLKKSFELSHRNPHRPLMTEAIVRTIKRGNFLKTHKVRLRMDENKFLSHVSRGRQERKNNKKLSVVYLILD